MAKEPTKVDLSAPEPEVTFNGGVVDVASRFVADTDLILYDVFQTEVRFRAGEPRQLPLNMISIALAAGARAVK